ncbi:tripartite tricarboxylate transporter substrate-binding protein [Roseiarcaceae bacterium H3SJ34-1]|uniref:Bug family tripartite tricarboxylate transporter substrate binding protein n=1 Tax=Terripilifer ovatus TaxID=3032367 RepID=UPI003AB945A2|nr:tripartite tricarboxylate transporter substrate-binding protein [Roseiarcaceae bacterium H3SJ34-1]
MIAMRSLLSGIAAAILLCAVASAQEGADFYKGKTVNYIVATPPGGGYDSYGRMVAEYMQKYLPGSTFVVKNVPGGGHLIGANAIYAARPDGLTVGTFNIGLMYSQLTGQPNVKFDLLQFSWIGKAASDPRVVVVASQSKVMNWKDVVEQTQPLSFGAAGIGSASYLETVILATALKLPINIRSGYTGSDDQIAMRRGEIVGAIASRAAYEQFVKNGFGRVVAQIGGSEKDAPQLATLVADPRGRELVSLVQFQGDIARLTAGPPHIAAPQLGALRDAYRNALEDRDLRARAEKLERPVEPLYGDDVLQSLRVALDQKPETIQILKDALNARKR